MRTAYIAGPMTGLHDMNFHAFFAAEEKLQSRDWRVLNPARMDYELYGWPGSAETHHVDNKDFIWRDVRAIMTLSPAYDDAIVMLPGWEDSPGAKAERALGEWIGLRILTLEEALERDILGERAPDHH